MRFFLLCVFSSLATFAASASTVLSLGSSSGGADESVITPVALVSTSQIVGLQIDFGFDPTVLTPGTPTLGDEIGSGFEISSSTPRPGVLRVVIFSARNRAFNAGKVLALPLTLKQAIADNERGLEILEVQLADAGGLSRAYALAPFVDIRTPGEGSEFDVGQPLTVEVDAVASTGTLASVALYVDGELQQSVTQAPYAFSWTASRRGDHDLLVVATNDSDASSQASRAVTILSQFDTWLSSNFNEQEQLNPFVSGPNADPDNDGTANGIEYLMDSDPQAAEAGIEMLRELVQVDGKSYLEVTVTMPQTTKVAGIQMMATSRKIFEAGDAPVAAALISETTNGDGTLTTRVYRDPIPTTTAPRFMYLEVQL